MHSTIYLISKDSNEEPYLSYEELDNVRCCNPSADYIGDIKDGEDVYELIRDYLPTIMPDFITVDVENCALIVAENARERYRDWMNTHVERIRKYQDKRAADFGYSSYDLHQIDVCTEHEDEQKWDTIRSLFYMEEYGCSYGYLSFIENLAYYEGQTLYIIGGYDYHY